MKRLFSTKCHTLSKSVALATKEQICLHIMPFYGPFMLKNIQNNRYLICINLWSEALFSNKNL